MVDRRWPSNWLPTRPPDARETIGALAVLSTGQLGTGHGRRAVTVAN